MDECLKEVDAEFRRLGFIRLEDKDGTHTITYMLKIELEGSDYKWYDAVMVNLDKGSCFLSSSYARDGEVQTNASFEITTERYKAITLLLKTIEFI